MKVIVSESLGAGYTSNIISSCNDAGVQAIADYNGNEILFYDPVNKLFARHSDIIKNMDIEIFDMFREKRKKDDDGKIGLELRKEVMKPTEGDDFEKFATEWDALQREESPDIIKTKNCSMIRFDAHESGMSRSSMKGEYTVKIQWTRDFPEFGIIAGDSDEVRVRFSEIDALAQAHGGNGLDELIEEKMNEEYPGIGQLDCDVDYIIANEEEMCDYHDMYIGKERVCETFDDSDDWSATEDEVEIQWMIDDTELGIESGSTETVVIDLGLVDCFEELVYQVTNALEKEYGMPFDYDDEWILVDEEELIRRFGCSMSESGSNGGTIDVTLKFTHGHYGKKLKSGEEKTIKLDTSTAPTIYDADDMLTWIADVASDQIPGGGCFTKYDFETIDPPDDVLIKAVVGDEGFGPDVDVDFEDFKPEDVPSEISYKDALKLYQKMHDAYDDRKLNYTKYDQIRNKLMDAVVKGLLKEKSLDELADEWFINYGTMNGWGWKTSFKYNVACALHKLHKAKHPDEHVVDREDTIRGWHSEKCSCGLASSSDSSD